MTTLSGRMINGAVVLDRPPQSEKWEGQDVTILLGKTNEFVEENEINSLDQSDDPESIERWIAALDAMQPLIFTPEEEAEREKDRRERREFELATWESECRKIEGLFP